MAVLHWTFEWSPSRVRLTRYESGYNLHRRNIITYFVQACAYLGMWWDVFKITTPGKLNFGFTTPGKILGEMFLRPMKSLRWDVKFTQAKENCAQEIFWKPFFHRFRIKMWFCSPKIKFNCDPWKKFQVGCKTSHLRLGSEGMFTTPGENLRWDVFQKVRPMDRRSVHKPDLRVIFSWLKNRFKLPERLVK